MTFDAAHRKCLAFLAGDLDRAAAAEFERHLLECDRCWAAVTKDRQGRLLTEQLREVAPPGLGDRIALATLVSGEVRRRVRGPSRRSARALALVAAAGVAALLVGHVLASRPTSSGRDPAIIAEVVAVAAGHRGAPGATSVLSFDGTRVAMAHSSAAFPMADGAVAMTRAGDPWLARRGPINVVCLTEPHPLLVASTLPAGTLIAFAHRVDR